MAQVTYCKSCGAYIPVGQNKCLACGFPVEIPPLTDRDFESMRGHSGWHRIKYYDDCTEQEQVDIDLDRILNQTFLKVKFGGKISTFYLAIKPIIERSAIELTGRVIDGEMQSREVTKRIIKLKLIER